MAKRALLSSSPLGLTRRALFRAGGAGFSLLASASMFGCATHDRKAARALPARVTADPFSLGVAAGAPSPDGFVLWTRLAPDPLSLDPNAPGGMSGGPVPVRYEIAADDAMRRIVRTGTAEADPGFAYSVHAELSGFDPGRPYWYRFMLGDAVSRVGRAITLPAPATAHDRLRLGFVSCSNFEHGYFAAYRHLADEHPDMVLFLGDYIYEYVDPKPGTVRRHSGGTEARDLRGYRNRYAQYRLDSDLQRLHAEVPALITWDDHEVENDYASEWSPTFEDRDVFLGRRAAAYQAFYEHMPLRPSLSRPSGPNMRLYDRFAFGNLAEISLLDGRQYRTREACYAPPKAGGAHLETAAHCRELFDPRRSMLGLEQEAWLFQGLGRSAATWNVIAQDVLMAHLHQLAPDGKPGFWTDNWDGYGPARQRLVRYLHDAQVRNPVVLSGDIHSFWANEVKLDYDLPGAPAVATEFVGTSISAHAPPYETFAKLLPANPHVRFFESRKRGYATVELTPASLTTRFRAVSEATDPHATVSTLKTFVVENGRPGPLSA